MATDNIGNNANTAITKEQIAAIEAALGAVESLVGAVGISVQDAHFWTPGLTGTPDHRPDQDAARVALEQALERLGGKPVTGADSELGLRPGWRGASAMRKLANTIEEVLNGKS